MNSAVAVGRVQICQIYRLLQCVYEGDKKMIEKLIDLGVEDLINFTEPEDGRGVLHAAVLSSNQEMVGYLLSKGVNPDIQDKFGRTAVMLAAEMASDAIVELLAQSGASFSVQDNEGRGVLFYCLYPTKGHNRCLQLALKFQADVNNVSAKGTHIFQQMCGNAQHYAPLCLMMLDEGADPNASDETSGVTALMQAAKCGTLQVVRAILKKGGDPNAQDRKGSAVVHYAAMGGSWEVVQVLSANFAVMDVTNTDDCNPLHYAAAIGDANCCKFLVQRGCDVKVKNKEGFIPQQIAKDAGLKAAAKQLKKPKAKKESDKETADSLTSELWALTLHDWCYENESTLLQAFEDGPDAVPTERFMSVLLEDLKAPVERTQIQGILVALGENEGGVSIAEFIKGAKYIKKPFLIASYLPKAKKGGKGAKGGKKAKGAKGAKSDENVPAEPVSTPESEPEQPDGHASHCSSGSSDLSSRFDLPKHPITDDSKWYIDEPEEDFVSIHSCVFNDDQEGVALALAHGVPVDAKDEFCRTPLIGACSSGSYEMVQYLLSRDVDLNACDQFFWTPLHHAAHAGHVRIVQLLVEAGATIDAPALNGSTPLMKAIESSNLDCVDLLIKAGASVKAERKEKNCLEIANAFADAKTIELVKEKMDALANQKGKKGKGKKK